MPSSPLPATVSVQAAHATDLLELNELAAKYGVFSIAEAANYDSWIVNQRARVQATIAKTKSELKRLDNALLRLEHAVHSMGRKGSTPQIEREYAPLEGWALTLIENYATLVGMLSPVDCKLQLGRLQAYTQAITIIRANGGDPSPTSGSVRVLVNVGKFLRDNAVLYNS